MANSGGRIVLINAGPPLLVEELHFVFTLYPHGLQAGDRIQITGNANPKNDGHAIVTTVPANNAEVPGGVASALERLFPGITAGDYYKKYFFCRLYADPFDPAAPVLRDWDDPLPWGGGGYWYRDLVESNSGCGSCHDCDDCLRCHCRTVIRWRGDRTFDELQKISLLPRYHHKLEQWQPGTTSLIWRLRFDKENKSFLDEMRAAATTTVTNTLLATTTTQITDKPRWWPDTWPSPPFYGYYGTRHIARVGDLFDYTFGRGVHNELQIGPVRAGRMHGIEAAALYRHTLLSNNYGNGSNWVYATPGRGDFVFGFNADWQAAGAGVISSTLNPVDYYVDVPLAIDIGCVRCEDGQQQITWPAQRESVIIYERWMSPTANLMPAIEQLAGQYGTWWSHMAPDEFTFTVDGNSVTVPGVRHEHIVTEHSCKAVDEPTIHSLTWTGDESDSQIAAECPPVVVVWTHGSADWDGRYVNSQNSSTYEFNEETWRAYHAERPASVPNVAWWQNWSTDTLQSIRSVVLEGVRGIVLEGLIWGGQNVAGGLPSGISKLADWLSTGSPKVLAVVNPYCCTSASGGVPLASDAGLLAALGSSMSLVANTWNTPPSFGSGASTEFTIRHTPVSNFIGDGGSIRNSPVDAMFSLSSGGSMFARRIVGGTAFETCLVQKNESLNSFTPWTSGAYEILPNGSLLLVYAQYMLDNTGNTIYADATNWDRDYFWNALNSIL